ncbi:MAG: hypothetical protein ACLFSQ_05535 [Candidatus Zixiibacteriota bacterium]
MTRKEMEQVLAAKALIYALAGRVEKSEKIRSILINLQRKKKNLAKM